jgi:predicted nucleic acid-binding protein
MIRRAERGEILIITSALTLAECLWLRGQPKVAPEKSTIIQNFFKRSYIRVVNVTRRIGEDAQTLVWDHSIKPKDAIHVATAVFHKVEALETFDASLIKKDGRVGETRLSIRQPEPPAQGDLDL